MILWYFQKDGGILGGGSSGDGGDDEDYDDDHFLPFLLISICMKGRNILRVKSGGIYWASHFQDRRVKKAVFSHSNFVVVTVSEGYDVMFCCCGNILLSPHTQNDMITNWHHHRLHNMIHDWSFSVIHSK